MFALTAGGAIAQAMPDVCITPIPSPTGPIPTPLPYPNIANTATTIPPTTALNVLICGMPALNLTSRIAMSNGDEAGVNGGVASGMIMGPAAFFTGSAKVIVRGAPITRLTSQTGHNGMSSNTVGVALVPSQVKVLVLS
jgi:hypothetical protein